MAAGDAPNAPIERLLAAARSQDPQALGLLLEHALGRLRAFVRLHLGAELRAHEEDQDIVQSTCREAIEHFPQFEGHTEGEWLGWLVTTARNKLRARHRFWHRERRAGAATPLSALEDAGLVRAYVSVLTPGKLAAGAEAAARIETALDGLSAEHREVITLARILGLPHAQIAGIMERSETAVRQLLVRALRALTAALDR